MQTRPGFAHPRNHASTPLAIAWLFLDCPDDQRSAAFGVSTSKIRLRRWSCSGHRLAILPRGVTCTPRSFTSSIVFSVLEAHRQDYAVGIEIKHRVGPASTIRYWPLLFLLPIDLTGLLSPQTRPCSSATNLCVETLNSRSQPSSCQLVVLYNFGNNGHWLVVRTGHRRRGQNFDLGDGTRALPVGRPDAV